MSKWQDNHEKLIESFSSSIFFINSRKQWKRHGILIFQLFGPVLFSAHIYGSFAGPSGCWRLPRWADLSRPLVNTMYSTLTIINDFPFKVHLISLEPLKTPQSKWEKMSCSHVKLMEIRHQKQDGVELDRVFLQMVSWNQFYYSIHWYYVFYAMQLLDYRWAFSNFWWSLL